MIVGLAGRSKVHRAGWQSGTLGLDPPEAGFPTQGVYSSALQAFQLIESGPPRLSRLISFI